MVAVAAGSMVSQLLGRSCLCRPMSSGTHGNEGSAPKQKAPNYFVKLCSMGESMLNVYLKSHHEEHWRPEFIAYHYLHIRSRPFPWEDRNPPVFHTPHVNPLPTGYEDE
uniref:Uncharacterized protein n=1 Tax=Oryctolagus cuniculus TaxID=9986 RepID=G1THP1_RABIT|nr:cytochrome c oxidase subunit 6A1, mitochondrial-like [Oryctolagus cuniculus]